MSDFTLNLDISLFSSSQPIDAEFQSAKEAIVALCKGESESLPSEVVEYLRSALTHKTHPKYLKPSKGPVYLGISTEADAIFKAEHLKSQDLSKSKVKLQIPGSVWTSDYEAAAAASAAGGGTLEIIYTASSSKGFWLDLGPLCKTFDGPLRRDKIKAQGQVICLEAQIAAQAQWQLAR